MKLIIFHDIYIYIYPTYLYFCLIFSIATTIFYHNIKGALLSGNPLGALGGAGKQAGSFFKGFGF